MALYDNTYLISFADGTQALTLQVPRITTPYYVNHLIRDEETIFEISQTYYGNTVDWYLIVEANDIIDPIQLTPGDNLIIPNNNG